jgi:hypothetical protein
MCRMTDCVECVLRLHWRKPTFALPSAVLGSPIRNLTYLSSPQRLLQNMVVRRHLRALDSGWQVKAQVQAILE